MNVLAIIPARGNSKGIPRKNLVLCGGKPLVDWTIEAANESRLLTGAILSSDDTAILERAWGKVEPLERAPELAQDATSTEAVMAAVLDSLAVKPDVIVLLQPTSPLRGADHIDGAIDRLERLHADSVVSVVPSHAYLWAAAPRSIWPLYESRQRRQEMRQYEENGAIYVTTWAQWERTRNRLGGRVEPHIMHERHQLQVDTLFDLELASWLLEREGEHLYLPNLLGAGVSA